MTTATSTASTSYHILILPSDDGPDYTHAVLYPDSWTPERADREAEAALSAAKKSDDWTWDDCEPELTERGFTVVNWHHGPTWDD